MLYDQLPCDDLNNKLNAQWQLRLLAWLNPGDGISFLSLASDVGTLFSQSRFATYFKPETAIYTNAALFVSDTDCLWILGGTSGLQIPTLIASAIAGQYADNYGLIGCAYQGAINLVNSIGSVNIPTGRRHWYVAHSYGGIIAQGLIRWIASNKNPLTQYSFSFGAPRPGTQQWADQSNNLALNIRWVNNGDVVPRCLPHTEEAPLIAATLGFAPMYWLNQLVQPCVCNYLDGTVLQVRTNTTLPLIINEPSLAAWLSGSEVLGGQAHSIRAYQSALNILNQPCESQLGPNRTQLPLEQPAPLTVRASVRLVEQAVAQLPPGGINGGLPAFVPPAIPDKERYKTKRQPQGWSVIYRGDIVWFGRSKREAKKVARQMNRALRAHDELAAPMN